MIISCLIIHYRKNVQFTTLNQGCEMNKINVKNNGKRSFMHGGNNKENGHVGLT
jgi:hypothetical protein